MVILSIAFSIASSTAAVTGTYGWRFSAFIYHIYHAIYHYHMSDKQGQVIDVIDVFIKSQVFLRRRAITILNT